MMATLAINGPLQHARQHGGPDALGVPLHDFSSNSNACGPCPPALAAVCAADPRRYPDASYSALRQLLARFHGVDAARIVLAGSASEFIFRITSLCARQGGVAVSLPAHCYGDYAQASRAFGLQITANLADAQLHWACEPSSPLGTADLRVLALADVASAAQPGLVVLDRAYEPLRLSGAPALTQPQLGSIWQLFSPNKTLGLTGVRAAYAIAPEGAGVQVDAMEQLCPSWPLGTHGAAMLQAWTLDETQAWIADSLLRLRAWKLRQLGLFEAMRWHCLPSDANFYVARPVLPVGLAWADAWARLRTGGIKLRDTASFGLPGHLRIAVQPPEVQDALCQAWTKLIEACQ
ncbi:MAG: aminotransferase [Polaromonas sp.]|nr:aminotransferase [Polaromonas sp.]